MLRRRTPNSTALPTTKHLNQQPKNADQNSETRAQQHERENNDQGRLEAAGSRHGEVDMKGEQCGIRQMRSAVAHSA
ncbi:hypothetical protein [Paraburkholderia terricola]|uniref:hypothetical protein n=1 Tax=Paraburkholderia terricola TaxID=169427 RepID=UPI00286CB3C7|nr:hypothetical protein [Paraburkholderia terricola]